MSCEKSIKSLWKIEKKQRKKEKQALSKIEFTCILKTVCSAKEKEGKTRKRQKNAAENRLQKG